VYGHLIATDNHDFVSGIGKALLNPTEKTHLYAPSENKKAVTS